MNNFGRIVLVQRFKRVNYYSVKVEGQDRSLFGQFTHKHTLDNKEKLNHILAWIRIIGNEYSAKADYFRNEAEFADTSALPPKNPAWEPSFVGGGDTEQTGVTNNLRLYTFRANEHVVFLFNGGVKTSLKAQNCLNVRSHFREANFITAALEHCFRTREIIWNIGATVIFYDDFLELNW